MATEIRKVTYDYNTKERLLTVELSDCFGNKQYIFIQVGQMIYVCDFDYQELSRRIDAGDIDSFESYDCTDGWPYYLNSSCAEEISSALLWLVAHYRH